MNLDGDPRRGFISASAMHRLAECPGSLALINLLRSLGRLFELPDRARAIGIRIHRWLKLQALGERGIESMLSSDELRTAEACVELRERLIGELGFDPNTGQTIVECRLWYRDGIHARFSGQPDFVLINEQKHRAFVVDYKTGRLEAEEAADNLQLRAEIVLLKHNFPSLAEISAAIIEPNVTRQPDVVLYKGDELATAESNILEIVAQSQWNKERRTAGPWCARCPAHGYCRESIRYVEGLPAINEGVPFELPRGQRGVDFWERIKVAKKLIETLESLYVKMLEDDPEALPGYVLPKEGRPRRYVPFPAEFKSALAEYLSADEIDGCAEYYLGRIQELLGIKHHLAGKELERLFEKLTRNTVSIRRDAPFIRKRTKSERQTAEGAKEQTAVLTP